MNGNEKEPLHNTVVSNSGPLIALAAVGKLDLLKDLFGQIYTPAAVYDEVVVHGEGKPGAKETSEAEWIKTLKVEEHLAVSLLREDLENVVVQTLDSNVPPLPDDLPTKMRGDLLALEDLNDDALGQVARSTVGPEQQEQISLLLERNRLGTIAESERVTLARLRQEADQLILRKAYAYVLLKWRGATGCRRWPNCKRRLPA